MNPDPNAADTTPADTARPARYEGLIQPIVVLRSGTHEQMVEAAARASVAAFLNHPSPSEWHTWLAGAFAKTVRRARPAEIEKTRHLALSTVHVGDAEAVAMQPYDKADLPREVAKLQVSGLDAERTGWPTYDNVPADTPTLVINADADMTTGKTCAQAAHGLFAWMLLQDRDNQAAVDAWLEAGLPFRIQQMPRAEFDRLAAAAVVVIQDAGHTEVDPGTPTVLTLDGAP